MLQSQFMTKVNQKMEHTSGDDKIKADLVLTGEVVFSEINYHKRAEFIFPPANSLNINEARHMDIEFTDPNGKKISGSVKIEPGNGLTCHTTTTYDVLLGLTVLWREAGEPTEILAASFNQLWMAMGHTNRPGSVEIELMLRELNMLLKNFISWTSSFITGKDIVSDTKSYNILNKLDIHQIKDASTEKLKKGGFSFAFHDTHIMNLKNTQTVLPVNVIARKMIKNKTAKAIHPFVERTLCGFIKSADNNNSKQISSLTITTKTLLEKHLPSLDPANYSAPSKQKRFCESLAKGLDGIPLSIEGYKITGIALQSSKAKSKEWMVSFSAVKDANEEPGNKAKIKHAVDHEVFDLLLDTLGDKANTGFYTTLARTYSHTFISSVIGNWKERIQGSDDITDKHAYFTATLHRMAHEAGLGWINDCGDNCQYK